jgi:RNA polymerase sigma-70 factor (ECF subfamily)
MSTIIEIEKQLTDEELVERIKSGDAEAFDILIGAYLPKVHNRVRNLVPESDADDVTQDIFMSLVDSIGNFQGKSAFATWFHRISMNKVADYHRKASRRKEQPIEDTAPRTIDPWMATEDEMMVKETLVKLPEKHREILLLRFAEGLSFAEVAEKLDLTYEATRSRFRRAIEAARDIMERDST